MKSLFFLLNLGLVLIFVYGQPGTIKSRKRQPDIATRRLPWGRPAGIATPSHSLKRQPDFTRNIDSGQSRIPRLRQSKYQQFDFKRETMSRNAQPDFSNRILYWDRNYGIKGNRRSRGRQPDITRDSLSRYHPRWPGFHPCKYELILTCLAESFKGCR